VRDAPEDLGLTVAAVVTGVGAGPSRAEVAEPSDEAVESWINRHAVPLPRTDAGGSIDYLLPLRRVVADAQMVGLGESAHATHEQFTLNRRAAWFLVERMGFRTRALAGTPWLGRLALRHGLTAKLASRKRAASSSQPGVPQLTITAPNMGAVSDPPVADRLGGDGVRGDVRGHQAARRRPEG
jgi:hypothetical protein